jgi:hypothetical protein
VEVLEGVEEAGDFVVVGEVEVEVVHVKMLRPKKNWMRN